MLWLVLRHLRNWMGSWMSMDSISAGGDEKFWKTFHPNREDYWELTCTTINIVTDHWLWILWVGFRFKHSIFYTQVSFSDRMSQTLVWEIRYTAREFAFPGVNISLSWWILSVPLSLTPSLCWQPHSPWGLQASESKAGEALWASCIHEPQFLWVQKVNL